ncbi:MAG: hypothetical protein JSS87_09590 [Acidobacteria bacterium]|nr:hypothetical protein [Acidobacteriota bacterium]
MAAYLVLILAALSRCLPLWMHSSGIGVTAAGAGLLFFGSRLKRDWWQVLPAVAIMACVDVYLTVIAYGFAFRPKAYLVSWAWEAALVLFAAAVLSKKQTVGRVVGSALFSATGFFLVSNGAVWLFAEEVYPHTFAGLMMCYEAGLPFYRNDAIATMVICGVLFGAAAVLREFAVDKDAVAVRER